MLLDAQVEMTARVAYIIRITRITLKFIHNALLVYKCHRLPFSSDDAHPAIQFTMETAVNSSLPFVGMVITKIDNHLNTSVHRKKTNKGLLLHYQSPVDNRYKRSLIRTMLDRAKRLSSSPDLFSQRML